MIGIWRLRHLCRKMKKWISVAARKFPVRVHCNVCGYGSRCLSDDSWHPYTICPKCESEVRHRLIFAALEMISELSVDNLIKDKRVLHFAPERIVSDVLMGKASKYVSADFLTGGVDLKLDMCNMTEIQDGSVDLLVACDVLEHVPDDSQALREIHRVLSDEGWAILTVPQKDNMATKHEDKSVTSPEERTREFGQEDHLRIYGDDFAEFLSGHGFEVTTVGEKSFEEDVVKKNVLFPPVLSNDPLATNHRKVFFAKRLKKVLNK